ncbi:hypothetical protein Leryth_011659 [Lithospermum erythrorhizon]|nr:hypothetical protein Leryth_011659 [Lithospermum erythrorhizon]
MERLVRYVIQLHTTLLFQGRLTQFNRQMRCIFYVQLRGAVSSGIDTEVVSWSLVHELPSCFFYVFAFG